MTFPMTMTRVRRWAAAVCMLAGASLVCGCSSQSTKQFESKWKTASANYERYELARQQQESREPQASEQTRRELVIEGPWEGKWRSTKESHTGVLRCILTRTGPDTYNADYHATYFGVFRFAYSMPLRVQRHDEAYNVVSFDGETNLGGLGGGRYQYSGHASVDEFVCTYRSGRDWGYFEMTRPGFSSIPMARAE